MAKDIGYYIEESRPADISTAVAILKSITKALAALHLKNRVWDFKESSILVKPDNSVEVVAYLLPNSVPLRDTERVTADIISFDVTPPEFLKEGLHDFRGDVSGVGGLGSNCFLDGLRFRRILLCNP